VAYRVSQNDIILYKLQGCIEMTITSLEFTTSEVLSAGKIIILEWCSNPNGRTCPIPSKFPQEKAYGWVLQPKKCGLKILSTPAITS
jgi:hypothetical protein